MKLWIYIVRRMLLLIPVVIGVMTITFLITSAVPVNERIDLAVRGQTLPWRSQPVHPGTLPAQP